MKKTLTQAKSPENRSDRSCKDLPRDGFFPETKSQRAVAVRVCQGCPALAQCAAWAVGAGLSYCVVGGVYLPDAGLSRAKALDQLRAIAESGAAADLSDQEEGAAWTAA
ncbi:WhiB family transcriptional regulator [Nocardia sp. 852002-51244_SCH5132740]|uniref:WhiB family transcriptional regulator n=1 Tax=Nocardia sp. 852002-51244_SCH5132740 TaxID=1834099 RepID=UPI0007EBC2DC|nr:WhiB family transcriptional regulator [Nocardia sp. 852002-51244_SCH5132740]OBB51763.1 hypothetical protein A5748_16440 [Nocardia sp. 852002-51244_SCH5132740]